MNAPFGVSHLFGAHGFLLFGCTRSAGVCLSNIRLSALGTIGLVIENTKHTVWVTGLKAMNFDRGAIIPGVLTAITANTPRRFSCTANNAYACEVANTVLMKCHLACN
jgi:hypothetical protein